MWVYQSGSPSFQACPHHKFTSMGAMPSPVLVIKQGGWSITCPDYPQETKINQVNMCLKFSDRDDHVLPPKFPGWLMHHEVFGVIATVLVYFTDDCSLRSCCWKVRCRGERWPVMCLHGEKQNSPLHIYFQQIFRVKWLLGICLWGNAIGLNEYLEGDISEVTFYRIIN